MCWKLALNSLPGTWIYFFQFLEMAARILKGTLMNNKFALLTEQIANDESLHLPGNIPLDETVVEADLREESLHLSNPEAPAVVVIERIFEEIVHP